MMTGTPQHSLHATAPRSAVWRVACKLNPCTQALRIGDARFLSNVFFIFITFLRFLMLLLFFSEWFLHLWNKRKYDDDDDDDVLWWLL